MNFRKTSEGEGGRGSFSIQKNLLLIFSVISENFVADFSTPEKKRNIVFQNEGGGEGVRDRLEVFRKFIQNGP